MTTAEKIQTYLEATGLTVENLACSLNYSPVVINEYLQGNYKGSNADLKGKCEQYIETKMTKTKHKKLTIWAWATPLA